MKPVEALRIVKSCTGDFKFGQRILRPICNSISLLSRTTRTSHPFRLLVALLETIVAHSVHSLHKHPSMLCDHAVTVRLAHRVEQQLTGCILSVRGLHDLGVAVFWNLARSMHYIRLRLGNMQLL